jgi:hypothetical protein
MAAKVMSELRINDKLNIFFSHTRMEPTILCQTLETTALTSFFNQYSAKSLYYN